MSGVYPPNVEVMRGARLSDDGAYRYALTRRWDIPGWPAVFIMLNPSTADADQDDPTIRRCVGFARSIGAAGIIVVNLYAYRATQPVDLWQATDPVGPDNDRMILTATQTAAIHGGQVIAAWGAHGKPDRVAAVRALVERSGLRLTALGTTKAGAPRHPFYLPGTATPQPWGATSGV